MTDAPLRVLFLVDFRSPIAQGWIRHLAGLGHTVRVVSTFPVDTDGEAFSVDVINLGFSHLVEIRANNSDPRESHPLKSWLARAASSNVTRRVWHRTNSSLAGLEARRHTGTVDRFVRAFQPDLIHAMRIPYEGVLAARLQSRVPLLISTWGNDLTLWAERRRRMGEVTRRTLSAADALHCDCHRDLKLSEAYGFRPGRPRIVLPGGGGVDRSVFHPGPPDSDVLRALDIPLDRPLVVNPRGVREYVRNDEFLRAWVRVTRKRPDAFAVCVGMKGNPTLEHLHASLGIADSLRMLPSLAPNALAELFRAAPVSVSPSVHDGTPNTLLEAMASGCLPVAGRLNSVGEWVEEGVNGLFCDATDPDSIAEAIIRGLDDVALRRAAASRNASLITERAERHLVMNAAVDFYRSIVG